MPGWPARIGVSIAVNRGPATGPGHGDGTPRGGPQQADGTGRRVSWARGRMVHPSTPLSADPPLGSSVLSQASGCRTRRAAPRWPVRDDNDVVELRTDACCWTRRLGDGQTGCRCRPHVVGSNAEREADHRTTLMADALVDTRAGVPSRAVVMNQQTEQRLVRYCDSRAIGIGSDEINPHAPELPSLTGPSHRPTVASPSR